MKNSHAWPRYTTRIIEKQYRISDDFAQILEPRHSEKKIAKKKVYLYGFCPS